MVSSLGVDFSEIQKLGFHADLGLASGKQMGKTDGFGHNRLVWVKIDGQKHTVSGKTKATAFLGG